MSGNIAVIGGGYWGKNLVRNFANLGALHTICDTDARALDAFKSTYPRVIIETDYSKVLANKDIESVVIAVPAALHYSFARQALIADKDIFVEKPLALTMREGEEIVKLAMDRGRILLVGHLVEYHPAVLKLKELLDKGEFGKIRYIYSNRLNLGKFRTEENILWSFAPHDISTILLLLGGEMPGEVSAHGGYYLHQDIADVTLTTLAFKNGVKAHIFVSWLHPYKEQKLVVIGEKKMALFDDAKRQDKLLLYSHEIEWQGGKPIPNPKEAEAVEISAEEPLKIECQDFLTCIKTRQKPRVDGKKGLKVLEVLSACQKSLEAKGKVILLDGSGVDFFAHETSIVEPPYKIGKGTKIWHFSHLMPGVEIGENCVIGQNVFIAKGVKVGNNVKIENNVSVFEGVSLEDDVFCGPSCVFTNVINPRATVNRKNEFKATLVKRGATIGANATIVCGHTIGECALIGAGAVVTKDVPDYALVFGSPARTHGWICSCGTKLNPAENMRIQCPACGSIFQKNGDGIEKTGKKIGSVRGE